MKSSKQLLKPHKNRLPPEEAQVETFQNPVQQQCQQAVDSSRSGLGQIADAVGSAIQGISRDRTEERTQSVLPEKVAKYAMLLVQSLRL